MGRFLLLLALVGCGNDVGIEPDALGDAPPRVIAGGGIGDGPIDGVVNLHVIDNATRRPIANATVRVGTVDGVTDDAGLFVARGITGPQTIAAKASGYRTDVWIGANGANVTMNLERANQDTPASGTLVGSINGFAGLAVPANHTRVAVVAYSQTDVLGDPANDIEQNNQHVCFGATCNFTVTSRTGKVALVAAIFARDNAPPNAMTLLGWASKTGLDVAANSTQTVALDVVAQNMLQDVTVSFGSAPTGLSQVASIVMIETPDGALPLGIPVTPAAPTLRVPRPDAIASGASYRLTAFATGMAAQSAVLRRGLTGTQLSAGSWLAPPTGTPTRTGASWSAAAGATVHAVEYAQGATRIASVTVFDGTTQVTLPDLVTMPSGAVTVGLQAIGAPGLDVGNFSLDADRAKLSMVGGRSVELN